MGYGAAWTASRPSRIAIVSVGWFAQGGWKTTVLTEESRQVAEVAEETIAEDGIR